METQLFKNYKPQRTLRYKLKKKKMYASTCFGESSATTAQHDKEKWKMENRNKGIMLVLNKPL